MTNSMQPMAVRNYESIAINGVSASHSFIFFLLKKKLEPIDVDENHFYLDLCFGLILSLSL